MHDEVYSSSAGLTSCCVTADNRLKWPKTGHDSHNVRAMPRSLRCFVRCAARMAARYDGLYCARELAKTGHLLVRP